MRSPCSMLPSAATPPLPARTVTPHPASVAAGPRPRAAVAALGALLLAAAGAMAGCRSVPVGRGDGRATADPAAAPPPSVVAPALGPTQFLDVPGGRLAYDDASGTGPLVVCVPGMGDLRGEYRYLAPELAAAGFRVVTLDVRGHGESSARWPDYAARAVGGDVVALLDHLDPDRRVPAAVVGTSFAEGAAVWAAHDAPGRVAGLVLIGPGVRDQPAPWYRRAALRAAFAGPWRVRAWLHYWDTLFPAAPAPDQAAYRAALARNLGEPGRASALRAMVLVPKLDTERLLRDAAPAGGPPALVVMGTKDPDFADPAREAAWVASHTGGPGGAAVRLVPGVGHYPHVEEPAAVSPAVVTFLRSLPASAAPTAAIR